MGQMNRKMAPEIDTVFLLTSTEHTPVNSTIVRDIIVNGGDASPFVPSVIKISGTISPNDHFTLRVMFIRSSRDW